MYGPLKLNYYFSYRIAGGSNTYFKINTKHTAMQCQCVVTHHAVLRVLHHLAEERGGGAPVGRHLGVVRGQEHRLGRHRATSFPE